MVNRMAVKLDTCPHLVLPWLCRMKRKIDFVIAGAQKSGSTSLHNYLAAHPRLVLPRQKEVDFFGDDRIYRAGLAGLSYHFDGAAPEALWGLTHVGMMFLGGVVERLHDHNPSVRIVAVLREPVSRAYSAYWQHRRMCWDDAPTFEAALEREGCGELPAGATGASLAYRGNGCYLDQLQPFNDRFGRERLFVCLAQDLETDPGAVISRITHWLGVGPLSEDTTYERHNPAAMPRWRWLQRLLLTPDSRIKRGFRDHLPERLRGPLRRGISSRLLRWNERPFEYPPLNEATRRKLSEYYAPHNERLRVWLGRDLPDWS